MSVFTYTAFGLSIHSDLEIYGLLPGAGLPCDVVVRVGAVPSTLPNALVSDGLYQAAPQSFLLNIGNIARYLVRNGTEILVDAVPGADAGAVRLFLLGAVFGALLHQRNCLPLHGSAVLVRGGAVIFAGLSGFGKSTLAWAFHQRGYRVLSDDICAIDATDRPALLPGGPYLMLWSDALDRLGIERSSLRIGRSHLGKYIVPLENDFAREPVPLRAIYALDVGATKELALTTVAGMRKTEFVARNTYQQRFVEGMNLAAQHFQQVASVANATRVVRVVRPSEGFHLSELADRIAEDLAT